LSSIWPTVVLNAPTGSHPGRAKNPRVAHPGFKPDTMSFKPDLPVEYKNGFRNPREGSLFERRTSFNKETIAAKAWKCTKNRLMRRKKELTGALQLVPPTDTTLPLTTTWKCSACAATSGYARPERLGHGDSLVIVIIKNSGQHSHLYKPAQVVPKAVKYSVTAAA
jgi:hypothetical protein